MLPGKSPKKKSGVPGVMWHTAPDFPSWVACWWDGPHRRRKHFSVKAMGDDRALQAAISFRRQMEREGKGNRPLDVSITGTSTRQRGTTSLGSVSFVDPSRESTGEVRGAGGQRSRKRKGDPELSVLTSASRHSSPPRKVSKEQQMAEIQDARKKTREEKMSLMRTLVSSLHSQPSHQVTLKDIANGMLKRHPDVPRSSFPLPFFRTDLLPVALVPEVPPTVPPLAPVPSDVGSDEKDRKKGEGEDGTDVDALPAGADRNEEEVVPVREDNHESNEDGRVGGVGD
uniref:Uncharacterized protein n=1 Tax=Chromera velia CCMP2878 TaxID=1169474 RepID=A0A0G4HX81_9ALVE|mmetsp:Transcript_20937/g.41792  ORF Transcript_20937/g.41792 Transcript_20937/m.41792 type:complete len:285 (-) Transcript_20937:153-1007(-)|eukprot:Cvel_9212.t1-p1 / transcript=Cvel_9212.t1 / gene=Cvel_9212 / organism=Chromera_velia_CCMP2878 / gene_product=hypothetical protein / transcript_product=hypothetical protein / location=Cvel_scaffold525:30430-31281(+) / protein_length=284 / sequence_SO=supercontig / SO=protein_coding / is_pseudo=false